MSHDRLLPNPYVLTTRDHLPNSNDAMQPVQLSDLVK
jgi:hypothetical protein